MRRYLGWVVATALLASKATTEANSAVYADTLAGGAYGNSEAAKQDNKESSFQQAIDEKIGLLRETAAALPHRGKSSSPASENATSAPNSTAGEAYGAGLVKVAAPWGSAASASPSHSSTAKDSATGDNGVASRRVQADADAPNNVVDKTVSWNDLMPDDLPSEDPAYAETEPPREYSEGGEEEIDVTEVRDEYYVRWDQDDCNPCEVPTQVPTLAPIYPRHDDDCEDHLPVVNDDYETWEDVKTQYQQKEEEESKPYEDTHEEHEEGYGEGDVHCTKVVGDYGERYECDREPTDESSEGNAYCTKVVTEYGERYECTDDTKPYEPTPAPTRSYDEPTTCPSGQQSIGVAGWDHDGCVTSGNVCASSTHGDCPSGAHCALLDTGVYGCKDGVGVGCSSNEETIGVVGWDHDGCIDSDNVCVAQVSNGDCPAGAYCALLDTGAHGCVASSTPAPTSPHDESPPDAIATVPDGGTTYPIDSTDKTGTSTGTTTSAGTANVDTGTSTAGADANAVAATTSHGNTASTGSSSATLGAGGIAGIAIGCAVFVAIVVGAVLFRQKSLARQREENLFADLSDTGGGLETDYAAM
ncbi:hypothetical protein PHYPSEUDO_007745 [Phytophthora pseudosyringae]|uniref:Uncharacterized protein n=1 Tax=Phytophthora pseudosyringae TaxID=221518 RepID=A0A8T1WFW1_9STRA|nr:hypothetical protein PHYPSEUDO_007745 [Phytophthora pseudosyringae]